MRRLLAVHRWCSVFVSLNFMVLSLTGLVLVFHEEIDAALGVMPKGTQVAEGELVSVGRAVDIARDATPGLTALYAFKQDESPGTLFVAFAEGSERTRSSKTVTVDRSHGGSLLSKHDLDKAFTVTVLEIHAELFAGVPGRLVLGVIGLAIMTALGTGLLIYGPTMRRFSFGMLRRELSRRTLLADLHKLAGAAAFGWNFVVASTGTLLCFSGLLLQVYAASELSSMGKPYAGDPTVTDVSTVDAAILNAEASMPGRTWTTVALPGTDLSSPRHYSIFLRGGQGIEQHMFGLAMVDAKEPTKVTPKVAPWWIKAVLLSEPLHFGNYGGLPLKIVWSLFTVVTLGLSVSGVWVFFLGRKKKSRVQETEPSEPATEVTA